MLFHEIYGSYFNVVADILAEAVQGTLNQATLNQIVQKKAFAESLLTIPTALKEDWLLLKEDFTTPIQHTPTMPLTQLQKRWLKTLLQDERIALFSPNTTGLEDVEPLFDVEDIVYFDQYLDGDPYQDETYRMIFRQILQAIKTHCKIHVKFKGHRQTNHQVFCVPYHLEYSPKDDKFRVIAFGTKNKHIINLARIESCELLHQVELSEFAEHPKQLKSLTFRLNNQRNALERVLLHFSHFEKETIRLSKYEYQVTLWYEKDDETELLIRVLSFGPMIQVTAPNDFIELVKERLKKQKSCEL